MHSLCPTDWSLGSSLSPTLIFPPCHLLSDTHKTHFFILSLSICVSQLSITLTKMLESTALYIKKGLFGSTVWKFQSKIEWPNGFGSLLRVHHHGRTMWPGKAFLSWATNQEKRKSPGSCSFCQGYNPSDLLQLLNTRSHLLWAHHFLVVPPWEPSLYHVGI